MKEDWLTQSLGDVCQLISGQHIDAKDYNLQMQGIGYLTGPSDFGPIHPVVSKWTEYPKITARRGDLLLTVKGSGVGRVNLLDDDEVAISRQLMAIRVTGAEPRFIYTVLSSTFDHFQSLSTGAAIPGISRDQVLSLPFLLPPLPEQQRIVALLDEAFAGLATAKANAEQNLQNACAIFESHLHSVFNQRGEGWEEKKLRNFCAFENGDRGSNYPSKKARSATGIPFINAGHLTEDGLDLANMDYIPRERFDLLSNGKIRAGDILFCLRGSLGKFACVGDLDEGAIASSLVIVRPDETVLNDYLVAYFRSSLCASAINEFKNGTAQPNLSARSLGDFIAPLPPLAVQKLIVKELADLRQETQRLTRLYERKLAALEELKKSLLHQAFNGEL